MTTPLYIIYILSIAHFICVCILKLNKNVESTINVSCLFDRCHGVLFLNCIFAFQIYDGNYRDSVITASPIGQLGSGDTPAEAYPTSDGSMTIVFTSSVSHNQARGFHIQFAQSKLSYRLPVFMYTCSLFYFLSPLPIYVKELILKGSDYKYLKK